jgi:hypothetical protein
VEPPVGEPFAAKTGAARGRSRTRRRQECLLPLLPLLPRRHATACLFFLLAGKPHHHTARLGCSFLQVPLPSSMRAASIT